MKPINLFILALVPCLAGADVASHWNGGRTVPVHRLAPLDAAGDKVSPSDALPRPISQAQTCGQCHDVASMRGGSHFRTGLVFDEAEVGVAVEPWFWADEKSGTAIPLSLHGQEGAFAPREVGLSCWQWTKLFGRHFPGGGIGSDTNAMAEVAGDRQRWFVTGALGPNCLACHQQGGYDSSEWARQVLRENWQGAATAASGLGAVEGMNERLDATWDIATRPENPDDHLFKVPEKTVYDLRRFDAKNRCTFPVGRPRNENCLACHGVSEKGMPSHAIAGDVHLKRGLACVDCHKNGMDHRVETTGCAACHVDAKGAGPKPRHAGIPLVHFEKLACTVCHAGVTADGARAQVRTARANRIGVYGRAQWATDCPCILEPVFVRNAKGVVEPRRMMWPSYFAALGTNDTPTPMGPTAVMGLKALSTTNAFSKAVVAAALAELKAAATNETFAFIGHGKLWQLQGEGTNATLVAADCAAARPVSWPVGHDVRPARQARGAAPVKCADCHSSDSAFFLGEVVPAGPMADADVPPVPQAEFLGVNGLYHAALGSTFAMRPLLKAFLWTVFGLLCLFVAAAAAAALSRLGRWISANSDAFVWGLAKWSIDVGFVVSLLYLALSGLLGWMLGGMSGIWLVFHMVAGGGFAMCAVLVAAMRAAERTEGCRWMALAWLLWTVCAAGTVFTAVMPMMTVFGSHGQEVLLACHRGVSLGLLVASGVVCRLCLMGRKQH